MNETGHRYGRLVVLDRVDAQWRVEGQWRVRCDCGIEKTVRGSNLRSGNTRSCGCLQRSVVSTRTRTRRQVDTATHNSWRNMRVRCNQPSASDYKYYGGRGITVDPRWDSFENFLADMGERPEGRSIDRIDNDGNYEPGNCRWATRAEQQRNKRTNV